MPETADAAAGLVPARKIAYSGAIQTWKKESVYERSSIKAVWRKRPLYVVTTEKLWLLIHGCVNVCESVIFMHNAS